MRVAILGSMNAWHVESLKRAFEDRGVVVDVVRTRDIEVQIKEDEVVCSGDIDLGVADMVVVRSLPGGSLEQVIYRVDMLHVLEEIKVIRVINSPKALERTVNKMYTTALFSKAGLLAVSYTHLDVYKRQR